MKIYRIPVNRKFQPAHQDFVWPPQNNLPGEDRGVEQDFDDWLTNTPDLLTEYPWKADFIYIPIYWNRYYINTLDKDKHWGGGEEALSEEIDKCHKFDSPMFTISEADEKWLYPKMNWEGITIFCASRRDESGGIDIPLLSAARPIPETGIQKRWLASFLGNLRTDAIRAEMAKELQDLHNCRIEHAGEPMEVFTRVMIDSYIALCPRGQGAQSFRMYEAMQLGTVPLYISDMDCRPFKNWIDWDCCSLYTSTVYKLGKYLEMMERQKEVLLNMGRNAAYTYDNFLSYGKWCKFVIKELELL